VCALSAQPPQGQARRPCASHSRRPRRSAAHARRPCDDVRSSVIMDPFSPYGYASSSFVRGSRKKDKDRRKSRKVRDLATVDEPWAQLHVTPAQQEALDSFNSWRSRWLTTGPQHPLAGQVCPSPGGILIWSLLFWGCRNAPEYFWQVSITAAPNTFRPPALQP